MKRLSRGNSPEAQPFSTFDLVLGDGSVVMRPMVRAEDAGSSVLVPDMRGAADCPRCSGHATSDNAVQGGMLRENGYAVACPECIYGALRYRVLRLRWGTQEAIPRPVAAGQTAPCRPNHPARAEALAAIGRLKSGFTPMDKHALMERRRERLLATGRAREVETDPWWGRHKLRPLTDEERERYGLIRTPGEDEEVIVQDTPSTLPEDPAELPF